MTVTISAAIRRGFLRSLWRAGKKSALSLKETLEAFQDSGFAAVRTGRVLVNSSGSGHSASFEIPSMARGFTQEQVFALSELFIQIYQDTVAALLADEETDVESIFTAMLADDRMQRVTQEHLDSSVLRYATSGTGLSQ